MCTCIQVHMHKLYDICSCALIRYTALISGANCILLSYLSVEVWFVILVWVWVEGWRWGGHLMLNYHLENLLKIRLSINHFVCH